MRTLTTGCAIIAALFTLIQTIGYHNDSPPYNDTYRYMLQAYADTGDTSAQAVQHAAPAWCEQLTRSQAADRQIDQGEPYQRPRPSDYTRCLTWLTHNDRTPVRYQQIFSARPGYPYLASLLIPISGAWTALWLVALAFTLTAGILTAAILHLSGATRIRAWTGQVLFLTLPTGTWSMQRLTDGPALTLTLAALLGALLLVRRKPLSGALILILALILGFWIRYSAFTLVCTSFAIATLFCLTLVRASRHNGTILLLTLSVAGTALITLTADRLHWPGIEDSLQDTFTQHFARPDVRHPLIHLIAMDREFWTYLPWQTTTAAFLPITLCAIAFLSLHRHNPTLAILTTAAAATGILTVAAHPVISEYPRLVLPVWLLPVLGLPLLTLQSATSTAVLAQSVRPSPSESAEPARPLSGGA